MAQDTEYTKQLVRHIEGGVCFWCPACQCSHGGKGWLEIGPDYVEPSVKVTYTDDEGRTTVCHVSAIKGTLHYHSDCTNGWANREVPMEKF